MLDSTSRIVLLVDDDPDTIRLLGTQLRKEGYETRTASNGAKAMRVLLTEGVSLIITDLIMPEMDGLEFCRAVRAHEGIQFAHIIMLTGQESRDVFVNAFDAGADDCLTKPVDGRELLARLRAAERNIRLQRELEGKNREVHRSNALAEIANNQLAEANRRLRELATTDELTDLPNRREAFARLAEYWSSSVRHKEPLACVMIDIDHFKRLNDTYGHAAGDLVLKETARILRRAARVGEPVYRLGGEEFLVVCPRTTIAQAVKAAERMRAAVHANLISIPPNSVHLCISLGVAERMPEMSEPDDLVRAADQALYEAKKAGRNTVRTSQACPVKETELDNQINADNQAMHDVCAPEPPAATYSTARVLLVHENNSLGVSIAIPLTEAGHVVIQPQWDRELASSMADGIDVAVIDYALPIKKRWEWINQLRTDPVTRDIPLILAVEASALDEAASIVPRVDEYVIKPVKKGALLRRIETMVHFHRLIHRSNAVRGEQSRALALVSEFCWRLAAADSFGVVLERTAAVVAELTCCRQIAILLPDSVTHELSVASSFGFKQDRVKALRIPDGVGTIGEAFRHARNSPGAVLVTQSHANEIDHVLLADVPAVVLPLQAPEVAIGVLTVSGRQSHDSFTPLELEYMELIGNIATSAINDFLSRKARDEARDSIVVALAKLAEYRDADTGRHLDRVTQFCLILANDLRSQNYYSTQINNQFMADIKRAIPLHDIGKVAIPDQVLYKPTQLTPEERAVMRTHTKVGAKAIQSVIERTPGASFLDMASDIAFAHHEWYNGQGYPRGLAREDIPLAARIAAVADVYDALTTRRTYKDVIPHETAISMIRQSSGAQFDPNIVEALLRCESAFAQLARNLADEGPGALPSQADQEIPSGALVESGRS